MLSICRHANTPGISAKKTFARKALERKALERKYV